MSDPGYCTATLVMVRDGGRNYQATGTRPTASEIGGFVEQTAAELDAILRAKGYTVPVPTSATSARKLLEGGNALGAAALVEQAAPNGKTKVDMAVKLWEQFKKALIAGSMELPDAPKEPSISRVRGSSPSPLFARSDVTCHWRH